MRLCVSSNIYYYYYFYFYYFLSFDSLVIFFKYFLKLFFTFYCAVVCGVLRVWLIQSWLWYFLVLILFVLSMYHVEFCLVYMWYNFSRCRYANNLNAITSCCCCCCFHLLFTISVLVYCNASERQPVCVSDGSDLLTSLRHI